MIGSQANRVWRAWFAATRLELGAPADVLVRLSAMLAEEVPDHAPPKFVEAVANIQIRSRQLKEQVAVFQSYDPDRATIDENQEKTVRHDLRSHAAYIIGICQLWVKQSPRFDLDALAPRLNELAAAAGHIVTLLDKLVAFRRADDSATAEVAGAAEVLRYMDVMPASQERGVLLVVDDNRYNRDFMADLLVSQGHQVATAADGEEALQLVANQPFDLILLDVLMPGMTGFGLLERLKGSELWRHIPVIMVSALEDENGVVNCIARGAEDYLTRPVSPTLLRARIGAGLEKKRLRDREVAHLSRIDQLLHALFPPEVVTELKETSSVRPKRFEHVGVMFLDVVGFTAFCDSRRDRPEEVVNSLQKHHLAFERIARAHGVQKIKTVGDAFVGVAGLLRPCAEPVKTLLQCGRDMIQAARSNSPSWEVRVGIHVGPVVAGVVGETQYSFDLWGDTVNTAARMETAARIGSITLSAEAWQEVSGIAVGEPRDVAVRGKGVMEVFDFVDFLQSERSPPS